MGRKEKLVARLQRRPKDFTWRELEALLKGLGYREVKAGKTGGSRRRFVHSTAAAISLHRPHPGNVLKSYQVEQLIQLLRQEGLI